VLLFLRGLLSLLCSLFRCHGFYSPFHLSWNIATFTSSQFVSCIESLKKIVKKKKRVDVCNSATHSGLHHAIADEISARASLTHFNITYVTAPQPHEHWRFHISKIRCISALRMREQISRRTFIALRNFRNRKKNLRECLKSDRTDGQRSSEQTQNCST
jgi:hypothetical protein